MEGSLRNYDIYRRVVMYFVYYKHEKCFYLLKIYLFILLLAKIASW